MPLRYIMIYGNILMDFPLNIFKNMEVQHPEALWKGHRKVKDGSQVTIQDETDLCIYEYIRKSPPQDDLIQE